MGLTVRELSASDRSSFQDRIRALERGVTYPLGFDRFEIDHGLDYYAFFDRLGSTHYHVVLDEDQVVAVACAVLRSLPTGVNSAPQKAWYLCDLKVAPRARRKRIPWLLFKHAFPSKYPKCGRFYGISMNPSDGSENPMVRALRRFSLAPISVATTLCLYSLDEAEMRSATSVIEAERGELSYLSLQGIKDIVLQSTGEPMPLLHVQYGPCAQRQSNHFGQVFTAPQPESVHMLCTPSGDPLVHQMARLGFKPSSQATVVQHRMKQWDWRFILTSEI